MKVLGIIGGVLSFIMASIGIYVQFIAYHGTRSLSYVALFGGILAFLLCVFPAIKKNKIALIGIALSLVAMFIGALNGTHMFD